MRCLLDSGDGGLGWGKELQVQSSLGVCGGVNSQDKSGDGPKGFIQADASGYLPGEVG